VQELLKSFPNFISRKPSRLTDLFSEKSTKILQPELLFLAQICTTSFVGWGEAPDYTGGAYSDPPDLLAVSRGPPSKGRRGGKRNESKEKRGDEEQEGRGEGIGGNCVHYLRGIDAPASTSPDNMVNLGLNNG